MLQRNLREVGSSLPGVSALSLPLSFDFAEALVPLCVYAGLGFFPIILLIIRLECLLAFKLRNLPWICYEFAMSQADFNCRLRITLKKPGIPWNFLEFPGFLGSQLKQATLRALAPIVQKLCSLGSLQLHILQKSLSTNT